MTIPTQLPKKILVVDDDPFLRWTFSEALSGDGFEVIEAEDGTQAFELFSKNTFAAVISDLRMPNGNGVELLKKIRSSGFSKIPVFLITGQSDADEDQLMELGATGFFSKPFIVSNLIESLIAAIDLPT